MDEQSHKDAMRAAVRGDFERLRDRRQRARPAPHAASAGPGSAGKVVLTPAAPAVRPPEQPPAPVAEPATATARGRSSWLRALRRRPG